MALYLSKYNTERYFVKSLEIYTIMLTFKIQEIINTTTPWKRSSERSEYWWIPEVDIAVRAVYTAY
jgi:hypothetical protein